MQVLHYPSHVGWITKISSLTEIEEPWLMREQTLTVKSRPKYTSNDGAELYYGVWPKNNLTQQ